MATTITELSVTDEYENPKTLKAFSFYGGDKRGMMLHIHIRHDSGNNTHIGAELTKEQAIEFANAILEKFNDSSKVSS